jgi:hypothetical protein
MCQIWSKHLDYEDLGALVFFGGVLLLAHLAKGNVSFCRPSSVVCLPSVNLYNINLVESGVQHPKSFKM